MKTVGIIAAMDEELAHFHSLMKITTSKNSLDTNFYVGKIFGKNAVLARSGIGKVNAASCAQYLIDLYNIDYVINIGAAGAVNNKLNIGDIVIAKDLVHHDFDVSVFGEPIGIIPNMKESYFKCDKNILKIVEGSAEKKRLPGNIYFGTIASGDQFISSDSNKKFIEKNFNAHCIEMEGAAIAQVCFLNKIPFIVIRIITDKADEKAIVYYKKFMTDVIKNSSNIVEYIVKQY